jgi:hypothetical protein
MALSARGDAGRQPLEALNAIRSPQWRFALRDNRRDVDRILTFANGRTLLTGVRLTKKFCERFHGFDVGAENLESRQDRHG